MDSVAKPRPEPRVEDDKDSELEVIDLRENPMYQVLSSLLESRDGYNMAEVNERLVDAIERQTSVLEKQLTLMAQLLDENRKDD